MPQAITKLGPISILGCAPENKIKQLSQVLLEDHVENVI